MGMMCMYGVRQCRERDRVQRKVWRVILGLERGANDDLLYGEIDEMRLSTQQEMYMEKYERAGMQRSEESMVRKMLNVRRNSGKDKWWKAIK